MAYQEFKHILPPREELPMGGLVGSVELIGVMPPPYNIIKEGGKAFCDKWHQPDCFGFKLKDPRPMDFLPLKGQLNFFNVELDDIR